MLEVRYDTGTYQITGWWGLSKLGQHDIKLANRPDETIVVLDIPIPSKPIEALVYNEATQSLIPNPDFVEPEPPRDLPAEVDEIKTKLKEKGIF